MQHKIRPAIPTDIHSIIQLCAEHAAYEGAEYNRDGKEKMLSDLLFNGYTKIFCLVVDVDGDILGYSTYMLEVSTWDAGYYVHMDCIYLREEIRGKGIGEEIINKISAFALTHSIEIIQWQTPVTNMRAIKFYERIGGMPKQKIRFSLRVES